MSKEQSKTAKSGSGKKKKVAVVLLNLGGPDSKNAIRPFLMNFFMDKNILPLPIPFRCLLAAYIARSRSKREAGDSYGELGDCSPLLENSKAQAKALDKALKNVKAGSCQFKSFICMRYWHPMSPQVVREVRDWGADEIVILPLYPQFSTTTTWSSLQVWNKAMNEAGYERPISVVCCYHENDGYVKASAANVAIKYKEALKDGYESPRILFSAHGLPESIIKGGDPYQWQCEQSAEAIVDQLAKDMKMDRSAIDYQYCYQSRVGPKKWIGPATDEALKQAADDGKAVVVYPHAFTQEHVETLVELDVEYAEEAEEMGLRGYYRAQTVGTHPLYIGSMAALVGKHVSKTGIYAEGFQRPCPAEYGRCCMDTESVQGLDEIAKKAA